jgi:hypothetical protein
MGEAKDSAAHKIPTLDLGENEDQHYKTYMSKSMKKAIQRFARRDPMSGSCAPPSLSPHPFGFLLSTSLG